MWPIGTGFWLGGTSWQGNTDYGRSAQGQLLETRRIERQHVSNVIVKPCRPLEGYTYLSRRIVVGRVGQILCRAESQTLE